MVREHILCRCLMSLSDTKRILRRFKCLGFASTENTFYSKRTHSMSLPNESIGYQKLLISSLFRFKSCAPGLCVCVCLRVW